MVAALLAGCAGKAPAVTVPLPPERPRDLAALAVVRSVAEAHAIDPAIAVAVARVESGGNCRARSDDGAVGVMQVQPRTAAGVGIRGDLTDCRTGAEAGVRYLAAALDRHPTLCTAVSAYQRGLEAPSRCTDYGRKVLAKLEHTPTE